MITASEHLERVLASTGVLETEIVPLTEARGRCLAESVLASVPVPPWTNSAMDGYAVRFEDVIAASEQSPVTLRVTGDVAAGSDQDPRIGPLEAARIMTGAPLPTDADTVIPQEMTDCGVDQVMVSSAPSLGTYVRHAGEDRKIDDLIVAAGTEIKPETLAAVVSAGAFEVTVARQPRVVVISTGDELVGPGAELARGQIPDSNALLVSLLAEDAGAVTTTDSAGDTDGELESTINRHLEECDLIVMTGGVSVGAHEPVKALFDGTDAVRFDRVSMQPGKPQAFGRIGETGPLVFGLPGNPISAWVSFQMFVRPCLRKLQGFLSLLPDLVSAQATEGWKTPQGRMQVIPVRIRDGRQRTVSPAATGGSGSHLVASLADADGYALVPAEIEQVRVGDLVETVRLRDPEQFIHEQRSST